MPRAYQSLGVLLRIDDRQEMRGQFPALLFDGEVLLVVTHYGHQNLVRETQKGRIEIALNHGREFVEVGDQFAKRRVFVDAITFPLGMSFEFQRNFLLTLSRANDDPILSQLLLVIQEAPNNYRARTEEAMPPRVAPRGNTSYGKSQRLAVQHSHNPTYGPNEARAIQAGPGHRPRPAQIIHRPSKDADEDLLRC